MGALTFILEIYYEMGIEFIVQTVLPQRRPKCKPAILMTLWFFN